MEGQITSYLITIGADFDRFILSFENIDLAPLAKKLIYNPILVEVPGKVYATFYNDTK